MNRPKWVPGIGLFLCLLAAGCAENTWEESERFESGAYTMIGEVDQLGFIYDGSDVVKFHPGQTQKYMWHFWGEEEELAGELKVVATHEKANEVVTVLDDVDVVVGKHNGADASTPSQMSLPESGMWKLDAFIDDRLHGSVYVQVHEKET